MKFSMFSLYVALACFACCMTGCGGGSGENTVVQPTTESGTLPADQQQSYEEAMKNRPAK